MTRAALLLAACALVAAALWNLGERTADGAAAWPVRCGQIDERIVYCVWSER